MESEYDIYNLKARVRLVNEKGFLFAILNEPLEVDGEAIGDIFVHASNFTNDKLKWATVKSGQNIMLNCITKSAKGWCAISVTLPRAKVV